MSIMPAYSLTQSAPIYTVRFNACEANRESPWAGASLDGYGDLSESVVTRARRTRRSAGQTELRWQRLSAERTSAQPTFGQSPYDRDRQVAALLADHQATIARQPI